MISKYTMSDYPDDRIDDILDYAQYGKCVYKPILNWDKGHERNDLILYDEYVHAEEVAKM